jgi:acetyl-CoA carboxylase carboxyltransferase component
MGGAERIARAREAGRLTVRERIDRLLDARGSGAVDNEAESEDAAFEQIRRGPRARGTRP